MNGQQVSCLVSMLGSHALAKGGQLTLHRVLLVTISKTVGGGLGFIAGRTLLRDWVTDKLVSQPTFTKALQTMKADGICFDELY